MDLCGKDLDKSAALKLDLFSSCMPKMSEIGRLKERFLHRFQRKSPAAASPSTTWVYDGAFLNYVTQRLDHCDLARPVCGRCAKRGTSCNGYQAAGSFTFRDETARAQRLSRRARGQPEESPPIAAETVLQYESPPELSDLSAPDLQTRYPWLNEKALANLPAQVKWSGETLAIENFFANWAAYPTDLSPGYMHHLPSLYEKAAHNSVLALAVRAVAFADMKRLNNGNQEYELKGLQNYAAAITRLRTVVKEASDFDDDQILAALLLIDAFEVGYFDHFHTVYMGRNEPFGLHDKALSYVLEQESQSFDSRQDSFYWARIAANYSRLYWTASTKIDQISV
ncbi:hypothetical protein PRZ48_000131 [Zasmidium cellare]|uniref:Zn(2)-C6 fungal-type domain-containing protein n=1 Tax=Zasmidium cellare TaxID=395010 RepID=A0ABR0EXM3_ZASCE|nr:hypothetical protein PRZ48_000131 [Zasmidium cellare]